MALSMEQLILIVIVGTLAAIIYSLRILVIMERRIARMEGHIEKVTKKIFKEELVVERLIKKRKR